MSKILFNRETLLEKLKLAIQFVPKKSVIPATDDFLFKINGTTMLIAATDLEKSIIVSCETLKSDTDLTFCIPAKLILSTLNLMLDEEVLFTCKKEDYVHQVQVKCGKSKYKITCNDPEAFPKVDQSRHEYEASFTGSSFISALEVTKKYSNPEDPVDALQGLCLRLIGGKINFYGASSHQFGKVVVSPRSINLWEDILIPSRSAQSLIKCISDGDIVDVLHNKKTVEIKTNDVTIICQTIDAKFPDLEKFFSKPQEAFIELNTLQFLHAVERVDLYTSEESPLMKIEVRDNLLILSAINKEYSREAEDEIDVLSSLNIVVGVSVKYMLNVIRSFENDSFRLHYTSGNAPIFIEPINTFVDNDRFFLIAPMNITQ